MQPAGEQQPSREAHEEEAVGVLRQAFKRFRVEEVGLAFNGGKDCAVALELLREVIGEEALSGLLVVHFEEPDEFDEVRQFVEETRVRHRLRNLLRLPAPLKEGLWQLHRQQPHVRAFVTGRRSTDPFASHETHFTEASPGWPPLLRVAPILSWSYSQVWRFIASRRLPVCSLYSRGFSSLGPRGATVPNPRLRLPDGSYLPAHLLSDDADERLSRADAK